jgi:predicted RNA-binding protein
MNIWLCPVKPRSWQVIKNVKVFGVQRRAAKTINKVRLGDLLVFHSLRPVNGIVGVFRVASEVYEDNQDIWGPLKYPLRVRLEASPAFRVAIGNPIPISSLFGYNNKADVVIEPCLKEVSLVKLSKGQFSILKKLFQEQD